MQFQFKIQLQHISKPPVWRGIFVPPQFSFEKSHRMIQAIFSWRNYLLYQFSPTSFDSKPQLSFPNDGWEDDVIINNKKIKLSEIFNTKRQKFTYIYDFDDDWVYKITLKEIKKRCCKKGSATCRQ